MTGRQRAASLLGLVLLAEALPGLPAPAVAWGFAAHRLVNAKAILTLPEPLRGLFAANRDYLEEHSIDPDLWRAAGQKDEGPNHFLDMDAFGEFPFAGIPRDESEHLRKFGPEAVARGRVPWRVAEVYRELREAFRTRDVARALERAAVLGHYVADAHVPLHAVLNYDGQLSEQTGVHARWESELVERFLLQVEPELVPAAAAKVSDPVAVVFDALLESFAAAGDALQADKASAGSHDYADTPEDDRYDDRYYSALFARQGGRLAARLTRSAQAVGSLWASAFEAAGRPVLDTGFRFPYLRRRSRLILASIDGASAPLVAEAVARGLMPNLGRLRARGASARGSITSLPAKTASGHATLFTGTWPDRHGVTGNLIVLPGTSITDSVSGYRSDALRAEPIWVAAARQGLDATLLCATQDFPYAPYQEEKRFGGYYDRSLTIVTGYKGPMLDDLVYRREDLGLGVPTGWTGDSTLIRTARELHLKIAATTLHGLLFDDPSDPATGFDTLLLALNKDTSRAVRLKPRPAGAPDAFAAVTIPFGGMDLPVYFRLFALAPDGADVLLYRAKAGVVLSNRGLLPGALTRALGGFVGNGAADLYRRGALGSTLAGGGDGTAERRYLETVGLVTRQFERLLDFGVNRTRTDVLVAYLPYPDEFAHEWLGLLDASLAGHDAALAARLQPFMEEALGIVDGYIGALARQAGDGAVLAVASDHGQSGVNRQVRINAALAKAGLLGVGEGGKIDLSRTKAFYLAESGYFLLNRAGRPGGIVRPEEEDAVRSSIASALRDLRGALGEAPILAILDPRDAGQQLGIGGPHGGDLYLNLAPGYFPTGDTSGDLVVGVPPTGEHLLDPARPQMHAAFAVAGPGVAAGVDLGVIREIDIAPTLAALVGIEPPAQSTGVVLRSALAGAPGSAAPALAR